MTNEISPAEHQQNRLLRNVLFTFFVSGAASQPLGSFIPFLREQYGFSCDLSGVLLSCQSTGNLISVLLAGFLPIYLGRRRAILTTSVWMAVAYLIFASGLGSPALFVAAFTITGIARGGNSNFSNTMISTLPGDKATREDFQLAALLKDKDTRKAPGASVVYPLSGLVCCGSRWSEWTDAWRRCSRNWLRNKKSEIPSTAGTPAARSPKKIFTSSKAFLQKTVMRSSWRLRIKRASWMNC